MLTSVVEESDAELQEEGVAELAHIYESGIIIVRIYETSN